jgi:hypothetical protein
MNFYCIALVAIRVDPEYAVEEGREGQDVKFILTPGLDAQERVTERQPTEIWVHVVFTFAATLEDAKRIGEAEARRRRPEADGWRGHSAKVALLERDMMVEALKRVHDSADFEDGDASENVM